MFDIEKNSIDQLDIGANRKGFRFGFMVFNVTFNNISAISWQSVLLVGETGDNQRPVARHRQTLFHNVVSSTPRHERNSTTLVVIGTDCIYSCKSNYHTITTTTTQSPPQSQVEYR
jgi:hypothetical protein